jgi:hypothetical protein
MIAVAFLFTGYALIYMLFAASIDQANKAQ